MPQPSFRRGDDELPRLSMANVRSCPGSAVPGCGRVQQNSKMLRKVKKKKKASKLALHMHPPFPVPQGGIPLIPGAPSSARLGPSPTERLEGGSHVSGGEGSQQHPVCKGSNLARNIHDF